ncbi:glutaredoxin [Caproiciproducens sp. NJN-50]|uniref:glutaredoxin n=1 Tax=Acutalibacteraceae TaxID=3082771 RepID=UPI000FFDFEF8|nr:MULTISPECIES: glutaredoxin [Acutalibacteraceae]QAT50286.1 glutaredoxin [Caproiciproducens sp. NJN-50]
MDSLIIYGSHLCPNTLYSIIKCKDKGIQFRFKDISANLADLKEFLTIWSEDSDKLFQQAKDQGMIGLPLFILPDGTKTRDLNGVLAQK